MPGLPAIVIPETPDPADREAIARALIAYNDEAGGPTAWRPFAILLKDDSRRGGGGIWGRFVYRWLFIEMFVVPQGQRRQGLGSRRLAETEREARTHGCVGVWLDTYAFQAPGFYLKHGFQEFGRIDDFPPGPSRHFFMKRLDRSPP
ncbi:MAG: GNAT family N-acetyltransferase [Xanthobacteraceae bacterium]|nr:GNAT family N-acetyltransferase [Xanthobacteraceae bacterium]